ncbi:MAG: carboxypeptidase-like regulatory domain-containing protein, partial [Pyrinomonadaceae bacterium]
MFIRNRTLAVLIVLFAALILPLVVVHSAGGRIEGKVTDQKGAALVGAAVTITDEVNNQRFTAVTDQQGHYKVEGLPAGNYTVVISAKGFNDGRRESVKLDEAATVPIDMRLEIASVEANVTVAAGGMKANGDPVYQQLRQQGKTDQDFSGAYAAVNNLMLNEEGAKFTLRSGEIY